MKDIRAMRRSDWHRILERSYHAADCEFQGMQGVVSLIEIQKVTEPLTIHYEDRDIRIADVGYNWLQLAFENQYFWATAMFNEKGEFLEIYFDITGGNYFDDRTNPTFQDMYLDIVLFKDGSLQVLDRDELDVALADGEITKEQHQKAVEECDRLYAFLEEQNEALVAFCKLWREKLRGLV